MNVQELLSQARDVMTVRRVFGEPIEREGVTIIPVANVPSVDMLHVFRRGRGRHAKGADDERARSPEAGSGRGGDARGRALPRVGARAPACRRAARGRRAAAGRRAGDGRGGPRLVLGHGACRIGAEIISFDNISYGRCEGRSLDADGVLDYVSVGRSSAANRVVGSKDKQSITRTAPTLAPAELIA